MRIIGLDLGSKTVGIAVSDFLGIIANPVGTLRIEENNLDQALELVKNVVKEQQAEKIVLGLPKNMDGTIGFQAQYCLDFKAMLEQEQTVIENQIKDSETTKTESEIRLATIEDSMANVEKEIDSIISASEENAKLVGEKIVKDGEKTALIIKENTEKAIENSRTILKNDLLKRASLASVEIAKTHIINELSWNQGLHDKLIDESIEALNGVNGEVN